ncbi:MAG: zinc finger Ran-binding domain-containing protein [Candidatus Kryptonium sp.]
MLCPICGFKNSKFNVKCESCGAFLQDQVYVLNLSETLSLLFLNPSKGFHKIILSKRKNFSILLASLFGIAMSFDVFYLAKAGEKFENLIFLIFNMLWLGIILGILFTLSISFILKILLFKYKGIKFKDYFAMVSYSMFPLALSVFFLLPSVLAVFGIYYFTESPEPDKLKPIPFYIFYAVGLVLKVYSVLLLLLGLKHITENFLESLIYVLLTSISSFVLLNLLTEAVKIML